MKYFEAGSTINASPEKVWSVLTDGAHFPDWDSGIDRVEGTIAPGATIKLFVKVNPGRPFPLKISEFSAPRRMVFSGGMPLGLFRGVRTYTLDPRPRTVLPAVRARAEGEGRIGPLGAWRKSCAVRGR